MDDFYNDHAEETGVITNAVSNTVVNGTAYDDSILNNVSSVTINGGTGNDSIESYGSNVRFQYVSGDGNDYIIGFNDDDTLSFSGNKYSMRLDNSNLIIQVDDGSIALENFSMLGNINIEFNGKKIESDFKNLKNTVDGAIITVLDGNNNINNSGANVSISAGAGDDSIKNRGDDVTINAGDGNNDISNSSFYLKNNSGENILIFAGKGNDTVTNYGDNATINVDEGNNNVENYGANISISASAGDDSIHNEGDDVTINAGDGNNDIRNSIYYSVDNYGGGERLLILAGKGDDTVTNRGDNVTINLDEGNNKVENRGADVSISVGAGDNTISNNGANSTINTGDGNNSIMNQLFDKNGKYPGGENLLILAGNGDDTVTNRGDNATINVGEGNNSVVNGHVDYDFSNIHFEEGGPSGVIISAGDGNNYLHSFGDNTTISAGKGSDTIYNGRSILSNYPLNGGDKISIDAGDGDNVIESYNGTTTIKAGSGNDMIYITGASSSTVDAGDGNNFVSVSFHSKEIRPSDNVTVRTGSGNDISIIQVNKSLIDMGAGDDSIENVGKYSTIHTGDGNDTIINHIIRVSSSTYDPNSDSMITYGPFDLVASNVLLDGGAGNDYIFNKCPNVTIDAGKGNDSIENLGADILFQYAAGDENDTIIGFNATSTLNILENGYYSQVSGNNVIITVGDGSITLIDAATLDNIDIIGNLIESDADADTDTDADGDTDTDYDWTWDGNKAIYGSKDGTTILLELDGVEKNVEPYYNGIAFELSDNHFAEDTVKVVSNAGGYQFQIEEFGSYSKTMTFVGSDEKDTIYNNGEYINIVGGGGRDSIINEGNNALIDGGKGNDKIINNAENVTISGGAGNDNVTVSGNAVGNIFSYSKGDGNDILRNFDEKDKIQISDNLSVEAEINGSDIVFKVGSGSITIHDGAATRREVLFVDSKGQDIDSLSGNEYTPEGIISYDENGEAGIVLTSTFKSRYAADTNSEGDSNVSKIDGSQTKKGIEIDASTEGIILIGGKGKDTLISGENDFEMTGGKGNDLFIYNGGRGVIKDYSQKGTLGKDKIETNYSSSRSVMDYEIDGDNLILGFSDTEMDSLTIEGGAGKEITFGAKKSTINTYTADGVYDEKKKSIILASGCTEFDASKLSKLITIDGAAAEGEISITGNKKANYITAGNNGSTLNGGKGKDTLEGGEGADVFVYDNKSGNKVIYNCNDEDGDQISLGGGASITEVKDKSGDLVLKAGKNKITLIADFTNENNSLKSFTFVENGETKTYSDGLLIDADKVSVTMTSAFGKTAFNLSDSAYDNTNYKNVSAELLKKAVNLTGDVEDNILTGGKGKDNLVGGDGSDTLRGGKGNDTLWGGSPNENYNDADTFIFHAGDGNDTIMDYNFAEGDMLQILDKNGNKDAKFAGTFDDDTLTLKVTGGGKVILATDQTQFNINNTTYTRQGNTLVK